MESETTLASSQKDEPVGMSHGIGWELATAIAMVVSSLAIAAYHFIARPAEQMKVAKIDVATLLREQQRALNDLAERMADDPQGAERIAAERARHFSSAIQQIASECGCMLLVSDAVVYGAEDVTPRLRELLHAREN